MRSPPTRSCSGFAYQKGLIPVSAAAIERAIELNGVAVEANRKHSSGDAAQHDLARVEKAATPAAVIPIAQHLSRSLDETIARRVEFLTDYQDAAYAARYRALVDRDAQVEADRGLGTKLTEAVARNYKLMAYKDEYEVARLYRRPEFMQRLQGTFEGDYALKIPSRPADPRQARSGHRRPAQARVRAMDDVRVPGPGEAQGLARHGLDVFGRTEERRTERRLIADYERTVEELLSRLDRDNHAAAVAIAAFPTRSAASAT